MKFSANAKTSSGASEFPDLVRQTRGMRLIATGGSKSDPVVPRRRLDVHGSRFGGLPSSADPGDAGLYKMDLNTDM